MKTEHPESTEASSPHGEAQIGCEGKRAGAKDSTYDPEFFECQCGEFCLIAECESHMEMHYAEGMSFDECERPETGSTPVGPTFFEGRALSPGEDENPLRPKGALAPSRSHKHPHSSSALPHRPLGESSKQLGIMHEFIDILRHSTGTASKRSSRPEPQNRPQRLGVSTIRCEIISHG